MLGHASERVRPGQRPRVRIGHVNLDLADHHEHNRQRHREPARQEVLVDFQELVHRLVGDAGTAHNIGDQVHGQKQSNDLFDRAEEHPARPGQDQPGPPVALILRSHRRHEAQVVVLFGNLRNQRQADACSQQGRTEVETSLAALTGVGEELADRLRVTDDQIDERRDHQNEPQGSRPDLQR